MGTSKGVSARQAIVTHALKGATDPQAAPPVPSGPRASWPPRPPQEPARLKVHSAVCREALVFHDHL